MGAGLQAPSDAGAYRPGGGTPKSPGARVDGRPPTRKHLRHGMGLPIPPRPATFLALALALVGGACGSPRPPVATPIDIASSLHPIIPIDNATTSRPVAADPDFAIAGLTLCFGPDFPPRGAPRLVLQDQREVDAALVVYRQGEEEIVCLLRRGHDDEFNVDTESANSSIIEGTDLAMASWTALLRGGILVGRARGSINQVLVRTNRGFTFEATVANDEFAVWWDNEDSPKELVGLDPAGRLVAHEAIAP